MNTWPWAGARSRRRYLRSIRCECCNGNITLRGTMHHTIDCPKVAGFIAFANDYNKHVQLKKFVELLLLVKSQCSQ